MVSYAYASAAMRSDPLLSPMTASAQQLELLNRTCEASDGRKYRMRTFVTWGAAEVLGDQQASCKVWKVFQGTQVCQC